ncbi:Cof-type HAD-IIB family hydrolase [Fundicoccus culcitae]|uniref:Cof-type HAD-IIB family hydrolase n=1 Tax=Fundicoccus culcitae TaxID=2969821 RepID=A0ABY5P6V6_9LACT|nr:Cof-type HAD-IIB family hydrolase [Fundicoccus culcitae]UUX34110.1 Cof-type HAD-IIB family hydrolase [Fundicoccus culcitae]
MQQHLIAIDLDGTTLNNQSKLSELTIRTLRQLNELGHLVSIVTGRPYRNSEQIYRELNIAAPIVNFNGALCHFPNHSSYIPSYHIALDREIAFDLFAHQKELEIDLLMAEGRNQLFTSSMNLPDSPYDPFNLDQIARLSRESLTYNPTALTVFSSDNRLDHIAKNITDRYGDEVSVRTWGGQLPCLEIVRKGINKAVGVQAIAEFHRIPQDAILAFGDEDNDVEMIQYAGHGVAMKNAIDEVKAVAKDQTSYTNDEEGLAKYLLEYFDIKQSDLY